MTSSLASATTSVVSTSLFDDPPLESPVFTNSVFSSVTGCVGSSDANAVAPLAIMKLRVVPKKTDATPTLYLRKEKRCCSFLIILISSPF